MARVMIVDDEPLIAMLAEGWLEDLGHQVVGPAHDLQSALRLTTEPMDAAILDVSLGADNSYQVARLLRERNIPVAFATGHAPEAVGDEFAGAMTLAKPFSFETFSSVLSAMISGRGA